MHLFRRRFVVVRAGIDADIVLAGSAVAFVVQRILRSGRLFAVLIAEGTLKFLNEPKSTFWKLTPASVFFAGADEDDPVRWYMSSGMYSRSLWKLSGCAWKYIEGMRASTGNSRASNVFTLVSISPRAMSQMAHSFCKWEFENFEGRPGEIQVQTHIVGVLVVRFERILVVLHPLDQVLVEAKAEELLVVDERLEDHPQAALDLAQLDRVGVSREARIVRQYWDGKHQHVVGQDVRQLAHGAFHCGAKEKVVRVFLFEIPRGFVYRWQRS